MNAHASGTVVVRTRLDHGIYRSERDAWAAADMAWPLDRTHVDLALDVADYRSVLLAGSYGGIGAGRTDVIAIGIDGEEVDLSELLCDDCGGRWSEFLASLPPGELDQADYQAVVALRDVVWDGTNHVQCHPQRTWHMLPADFTREQLSAHCSVKWTEDGVPYDLAVDDGYEVVDSYEDGWGNRGWDHRDLGVEGITRALYDARVPCEVAEMGGPSDGAGTRWACVYVIVATDDVVNATNALDAVSPE